MIRRLNAAWSAFRNPPPRIEIRRENGHVLALTKDPITPETARAVRVALALDGADLVAAVRRHQRRNGRPPTV